MEATIKTLAIISIIPSLLWLLITMHVLYFSELNREAFKGFFQFWPFYDEMKTNYPVSSKWARTLTYTSVALALPWFLLSIYNLCQKT